MARNGENGSGGVMDLSALPKLCIANVLGMTSPRDACRLSLVASNFRSVAEWDDVWERFLPSDYEKILARSDGGEATALLSSVAGKKLYLHLCDHPVVIDGHTKSFSLEKSSGKKCYMLAARGLSIVWADNELYWKWIALPESRFSMVAMLHDVCWLEIRGTINTSTLSPRTTYAAYFVYTMKSQAYGFDRCPADVSVGITGRDSKKRRVFLDPVAGQRYRCQILPMQRDDGWMEIEMGEYFNKGKEDGELEMSLMQLKGAAGNWKSGLIVEGIEIRPKERRLEEK